MTSVNDKQNKIHNKAIRNIIVSLSMAAAAAVSGPAQAYDLQANTIYAQSAGGIYAIDIEAGSAERVADANASLSALQDLAFDGNDMYGVNLHWQLMRLSPQDDAAVSIKDAESFSIQYRGLESRNGILYGAESNALEIIDKATGNPQALCDGCGAYGLGAGEEVTDLAFDEAGTLYATVYFDPIPYTYLGVIDTATGQLTLLGNTGIENINAITVKDGEIYAMDPAGDLFILNKASGFATEVASAVLAGVTGMDTSPMDVSIPVIEEEVVNIGAEGAGGEGGGGSMSWLALLAAGLISVLRRFK